MPEILPNSGYLETDIDEILEQTTNEPDPIPNGGCRPTSQKNGDIDSKHLPENNVSEKTPFLNTEPNHGDPPLKENSSVISDKDENQTNPPEANTCIVNIKASDKIDQSESSNVVAPASKFPKWRHIAAVVLFFPLGWFAYHKAKKAYKKGTKYQDGQRKREFAEGLITVSICLGVSMFFLLVFLLITFVFSSTWQPKNLANFCNTLQLAGFTSPACPSIDIG